ncbi:hypothetical protein MASR1M45_20180 [Candidatus Kapaibacterium sp.]
MKIVIDTNILVSFCLKNEYAQKILQIIPGQNIRVFADERLLHEYGLILSRDKLKLEPDKVKSVKEFINSSICKSIIKVDQVKFNPDRQDSKLIEIANNEGCDYIVTDDKQLLANSAHLTYAKTVSAEDFIKILGTHLSTN